MHKPVLLNKVIQYLDPRPGENFIDCTVGAGGHSLAILEKNKPGKVLAIDWDINNLQLLESRIQNLESKIKNRLILANDNFKNLKQIVKKYNFYPINGILFDLGLSSWQIEESGKGFSFKKDEILDMRLNKTGPMAKEIINSSSQEELTKIFSQYGEERYSRRIAKAIKQEPIPIQTTERLREIIEKAIPRSGGRRGQISRVLARIFQALRIVVNNELDNLKQGLKQGLEILEPDGRLVVISFHSLEDRIVKNFFKNNKSLQILTKKPIRAIEKEILKNPRSRSAKLRAAIKQQ